MSDTILAIDIGSTKICAIIAEIDEGKIQIQGQGISKSQGIKKGAITNIELASKAIKKAINDAKRIAGSNITSSNALGIIDRFFDRFGCKFNICDGTFFDPLGFGDTLTLNLDFTFINLSDDCTNFSGADVYC